MKSSPAEECPSCGERLQDPPLCYGGAPPWRIMGVPESEFEQRVDLTPDQCVVDEKHFFVRGHIELPIVGEVETFAWSVWCSLSEKSFLHMSERWFEPERMNDPSYFGWLMTELPCYPSTLHLETNVQPREVGVVPAVFVQSAEHPLALEQQAGISMKRVFEFAHELLHTEDGVEQSDRADGTEAS